MKIISFLALFFIFLIATVFFINSLPPIKLLTIKGNELYCEIADTPDKRSNGLMRRDALDSDKGMVFVYQEEDIRTFHMANVKIPLAIAFADQNGIIVHTTEMTLDNKTTYSSEKPAMYAVEANKGWFSSRQIKVGDKIEGLNFQK
jgi:uncharacterized membrane protein (UPF0127 family)